jgi:redox-sensitive bicupin YhaK (pirin superfamily)
VVSNLEREPREAVGGGTAVAESPTAEPMPGREVVLGGTRGMTVVRTLPHRERRMVGAWCFVDQYGPEPVAESGGMRVPPHPHTGLQTVSWLVAGEVLHRDSVGNLRLIRPGQLNLMTAGRAIAHSEETPSEHSALLHGVQLWVALPGEHRQVAPHFEHHGDLPVVRAPGACTTVIMGELDGAVSPARTYSPLLGAEVALDGGAATTVPLRPDFEHGALTLAGSAAVDGVPLTPGTLLYLGAGRSGLPVRADAPARVLLIGGEPFEEQIVMWWNFVGRSHEEIVRFREDWAAGREFGEVRGYAGERLPAPALPTTRLRPRGRQR